MWEDALHHESLGKCKPKPQGDTTSHLPGWLLSKRLMISVGKDVGKLEPSYVAGAILRV